MPIMVVMMPMMECKPDMEVCMCLPCGNMAYFCTCDLSDCSEEEKMEYYEDNLWPLYARIKV